MALFKISSRLQHALSLLSYLARSKGQFVSLNKIAKNYGLSQGYLEEITTDLRRHQLIEGRKGLGGGYCLSKKPSQIYLLEVFRAVEGEPVLIDCFDSKNSFNCMSDKNYSIRKFWADLNGTLLARLSTTTMGDLSKNELISRRTKIAA